jgi:hypothetical protein
VENNRAPQGRDKLHGTILGDGRDTPGRIARVKSAGFPRPALFCKVKSWSAEGTSRERNVQASAGGNKMIDQEVVVLTDAGARHRVLSGAKGMTFIVDRRTRDASNNLTVAHVRDYRYPGDSRPYQIWTLSKQDYEVIL